MPYLLFALATLLFLSLKPWIQVSHTLVNGSFKAHLGTLSEPSGHELGSDCDSTFIRRYGNQNVSEEGWFLLPIPGSNFLIGGQEGDHSVLLRIDGAGNILWQRAFDFTPGNDFIRYLTLDSDGYLVGSARDQLNAPTVSYVFKYDYQNDNFLWIRNLSDPTYTRIEGILENPVNANYILYGMTDPGTLDNYILEVDRNTGAPQWQRQYDFGGNTDVFQAHALDGTSIYFANVLRLGGGLDEIRASIARVDLSGNLNWARSYFQSPNQSARTYTQDILLENDTLVCVGRGSLTDDNLTNSTMQLFKTDLDGNILLAKRYNIAGGNTVEGHHVNALPDGYILQGNYIRNGKYDVFFIRVDNDGNVVWSKRVGTDEEDYCFSAALSGNFICFAARSQGFDTGSNYDILFGKIALDGSVPANGCDLIEDIQVTANNIANPYDGMEQPASFSPNYSWNAASESSLNANLPVNEIPGCECVEIADPCASLALEIGADTLQVCIGASLTLTLNLFDHYQWSPSIYLNCDTCSTVILSPATDITYIVQATTDSGCSKADTVTVILVSEIFTSEMVNLCDGDTAVVFGDTVTQTGQFSKTFTSSSGCDSTHTVTVQVSPPLFLQLPVDVTIELGNSFTISPNLSQGVLQYVWTPDTWLSCNDCPNPLAQPEETILYTLTVEDPAGCMVEDNLLITVIFVPAVYVPNSFSPNGDGINDKFTLMGKDIAEIRLLRIFDRWGDMVYEGTDFPANDVNFGWDGRFRGKLMNPAVFAYYAIVGFIDGKEEVIKGDLTLLR